MSTVLKKHQIRDIIEDRKIDDDFIVNFREYINHNVIKEDAKCNLISTTETMYN
jgi:hypothetical protein